MPWFFKKGVKRRTTPGDEENSDNSLTVLRPSTKFLMLLLRTMLQFSES